jgi:hypothetical protein
MREVDMTAWWVHEITKEFAVFGNASNYADCTNIQTRMRGENGMITWPEETLSVGPRDHTQGPQASYRIHNDMLKADMIYENPLMRDCIENCGKTFRIQDETEFRCDTCKEKIRKMQLRVEAGNSLLDACEAIK